MLIGLSKRFIFVSTLKTASTSIEQELKAHAEICLLESQFGKHMTVQQMKTNLSWLFVEEDDSNFFKFAVMRDPVEFVLSIYNSHKHPAFRNRASLYTGAMSFDEFLETWMVVNRDHVVPQHSRLLTRDGTIGVNYVIAFEDLHSGLRVVTDRIKVPPVKKLPNLNRSSGMFSSHQLSSSQKRWITERFAEDVAFMATYCGKLI